MHLGVQQKSGRKDCAVSQPQVGRANAIIATVVVSAIAGLFGHGIGESRGDERTCFDLLPSTLFRATRLASSSTPFPSFCALRCMVLHEMKGDSLGSCSSATSSTPTGYENPPRGDSRLFHRRERGRFVRNVVPTFLTASFTEIFEASAAFLKASYVRFRRSPWSSCGSPHPHVMHISDSPLNEV